jgi:choline dehydrogenase
MKAGARSAIEITHEGRFGSLIAGPALHGSDTLDDAALEAHIARWTQTLYHPVGTCAMGSGDDAVVEPDLRVRGVEGLRVADASVMPRIVRGNTNAASIMIGEKAADLVRERTTRLPETSRVQKEGVR